MPARLGEPLPAAEPAIVLQPEHAPPHDDAIEPVTAIGPAPAVEESPNLDEPTAIEEALPVVVEPATALDDQTEGADERAETEELPAVPVAAADEPAVAEKPETVSKEVELPDETVTAEPQPEHRQEPTTTAAPEPPMGPSLTALDPEEGRLAVARMAGRGLSDEEVARVSALVLDPDAGVRGLALGVLTERADSLDGDTVHRALQDPADEVRAVAVRLVAARGPKELAQLTALIGARRWPQTQRTVLEIVPDLVSAASPLREEDLSSILSVVGELDPPPQDWERNALALLGSVIGVPRLIDSLGLPDLRHVGAGRLLAEARSPAALRSLAAHLADPLEEM